MLRDVGELLAERLAIVEVAVESKLAGLDVGARLDSPGQHVGILSAGVRGVAARAGRVLPVEMSDDVGAPAQVRRLLREVESRLELWQPRGLAVADVDRCRRIAGRSGRSRALHRRELELNGERCTGGAQVLVEKHAREPP